MEIHCVNETKYEHFLTVDEQCFMIRTYNLKKQLQVNVYMIGYVQMWWTFYNYLLTVQYSYQC